MSYQFDLASQHIQCDSADEMRQVFSEVRNAMNGHYPMPRPAVLAHGIDTGVGNGVGGVTLKKRRMANSTKSAIRRAQREAKKIAAEHNVTLPEAYQIRREIIDGTRTPTGRLRKKAK